MRFFRGSWLIGASLSLEGMRRTFIGGSSLSLFIIKEFGLSPHAQSTLDLLRGYLDIEAGLIDAIPEPFRWLVSPWTDHHNSGVLFVRILDELVKLEFPSSCTYFWQEPAPK
jgi:hypothetical protein